ncbi:DUF1828 domain-containing protein [Avibacterium paragallinarum]|uniref:DUF1828 domain-containing protein n=1 Tax=Avibacterium paragallinarum TaxID=728 RepID=UPI00102A18BF|nr:DUF1828 domain-containing protein [Avibacterium paragallinarum]RZN55155.1 DUF1828 domain-containing protein [Avibacterium paragallinarum]
MICSTVLSNLGYECHSIADDLILINTPFTLEDGSVIQAYIEQVGENRFTVTDDAQTLWEMNARGINLTTNRIDQIKSTLKRYGLNLNDRAEINTTTSGEMLTHNLQRIIQAAIITDTLAMDWYNVPIDKFEIMVKSDFRHHQFPQNIGFDVKKSGLSGHQITIPISLTGGERHTKQIFTTSVKAKGSWSSAYGVLGKIMDLTNPTAQTNDESYVVIDDKAVGDQLNKLILLFNQSPAKILPYDKKDIWLEKLAA